MGSDSAAKAAEATAVSEHKFKSAYGINLHKLLCLPAIYGMMVWYDCFTPTAWAYLTLHSAYGLLWIAKELIFPDRNFQQPCPAGHAIGAFIFCGLYWVIPWILVAHSRSVSPAYQSLVTAIFTSGMFLMHGSDCQKYFMLKAAPGKLITNGFFKYNRNPNYLGELIIYISYSMLTNTLWGFIPTLVAFLLVWVPNMIKKEKSMSRYPEFADWKSSSYLILPFIY